MIAFDQARQWLVGVVGVEENRREGKDWVFISSHA
jgi:hypothetical protein